MKAIHFEWDYNKASSNIAKHGVSFSEASTVFDDLWARITDDPNHPESERRFLILGMSSKPRLLIVCHCYRNQDEAIRIISARKAKKAEIISYFKFRKGHGYARRI